MANNFFQRLEIFRRAASESVSGLDGTAVHAQDLCVNLEGRTILWNVQLTLKSGESLGIMGPNGGGKSTLLKALLGLVPKRSGTVHFWGKDFAKVASEVAYLPQRDSLDWDFPISVLELLQLEERDLLKCKALLQRLDLHDLADRRIQTLSGGQAQRVQVARALLRKAKLYLLDEPFRGVDLKSREILTRVFQEEKANGAGFLIVHHDLFDATDLFSEVVLVNRQIKGRVGAQNLATSAEWKACLG